MRSRVLRAITRTTVIVTTKAGASFRGVLLDVDDRALILAGAAQLDPRGAVPVDGQLVILVAEVAYVQAIAPPTV